MAAVLTPGMADVRLLMPPELRAAAAITAAAAAAAFIIELELLPAVAAARAAAAAAAACGPCACRWPKAAAAAAAAAAALVLDPVPARELASSCAAAEVAGREVGGWRRAEVRALGRVGLAAAAPSAAVACCMLSGKLVLGPGCSVTDALDCGVVAACWPMRRPSTRRSGKMALPSVLLCRSVLLVSWSVEVDAAVPAVRAVEGRSGSSFECMWLPSALTAAAAG